MAIEYQVIEIKPLGGKRIIKALLKDGTTVKEAQITVARNTSPTPELVQAAWDAGSVIENGVKAWNQLQLRDADDNSREVIDAILTVVRSSPTPSLAAMITAGETAIADNARQQALYNRILSALSTAPNNTQRWQFLGLLATVAFAKIGQRD
jgi:hypothetical protein